MKYRSTGTVSLHARKVPTSSVRLPRMTSESVNPCRHVLLICVTQASRGANDERAGRVGRLAELSWGGADNTTSACCKINEWTCIDVKVQEGSRGGERQRHKAGDQGFRWWKTKQTNKKKQNSQQSIKYFTFCTRVKVQIVVQVRNVEVKSADSTPLLK